jgi:TetR/AcrR family transcriptional repressor of nem operon
MTTSDTKKQISIFTDTLIHTRGFHGFSYKDIADKIGIRKASIHHHYPSKEGLVASVIEFHIERFERWVEHFKDLTPTDQLYKFKQMYKLLSHDCTQICPVGMLTAEYTTLPITVQEKVTKIWDVITSWLISTLTLGQNQNEFLEFNTELKATLIITVFSGMLKTIRISKNMEEFDLVTDDIIQSLLKENK